MEVPSKKVNKKQNQHSDNDSDEGEDDYEDNKSPVKQQNVVKIPRQSVSAEVYGSFNPKGNYVPKVVQKSQQQKDAIRQRLESAFMFSALDQQERNIVIDAMEEVTFKSGEWIIKQGDDGQVLYVVDSGSLKCFKKFSGSNDQTYLKTYKPGESFGELALLYNAPRAASIQAETDVKLFSLDRECFNHIVRDAASKKREKYEKFLQSVELLSDMDPYERITISDALKEQEFKAGQNILNQGDQGDSFYFLESGKCIATKILKQGEQSQQVFEYHPGDYFGELALLKDVPRQATIKAVTDVKVVCLDRQSFLRLLGPLDDILKRNTSRYEKFM